MGNENTKPGGGGGPPNAPRGAPSNNSPPAASTPAPSRLPKPRKETMYFMKLVLRGARGVGKSALLARLQGAKVIAPTHVPTPEITTATISWAYKNADDKIEVEVWDVVDRALSEEAERGEVDDDDAPAGALCVLRA